MKRILFLTDSPLDTHIRALKTLTTLSNEYLIHVIHRDEMAADSPFHELKNVTYQSVPYTNHNFFSRTIFLGNDFSKSIERANNQKPITGYDMIYCVDLWTLAAGKKLSIKMNAKLVYDSYEICVETIPQYFPSKGASLKAMFFKCWVWLTKEIAFLYEKSLLNAVDFFITTCDSYLNYFNDHYRIKRSVVVMNCPAMVDEVAAIDLHVMCGIEKQKKILLYIGNYNEGRKLEAIIESATYLKSDCHILFFGMGPLKDNLKKLAEQKSNVTISGSFKMNETLSIIKGADLGILLLEKKNLSKYLASANKVFDFLMAEKPMILSDTPENKMVSDYSTNFMLLSDDTPQTIAKTVNEFLGRAHHSKTKLEIDKMTYAKSIFNWHHQETKLLEGINEVFKN